MSAPALASRPIFARDGRLHGHLVLDLEDYLAHCIGVRWGFNGDYIVRWVHEPVKRTILLSRELLGLAFGDPRQCDHINGNTFDNRRCNLRIVTNAENAQNHRSWSRSSSRFRGVSWHTPREKWVAYCAVDGRTKYLGLYTDEVEAARVAEAARREHMPFSEPDPELRKVTA